MGGWGGGWGRGGGGLLKGGEGGQRKVPNLDSPSDPKKMVGHYPKLFGINFN